MSWLTRINSIKLQIITGDGKSYYPIFNTASDTTPVNEAVFEFANKKGGYVPRGFIGVKQFNVEWYFSGEDVIETIAAFEKSAEDTRPWTLIHPYYDKVLVQPSSLNFNRSSLNVVVFTTTLYETIEDSQPNNSIDVQSDVLDSIDATENLAVDNATETNTAVSTKLIASFKSSAITDEDYQAIISAGNDVLNNISDASLFMRSTSTMLRAPAKYYATISTRIDILKESFSELTNIFLSDQEYFENAGALYVNAMCEVAVVKGSEISADQDLDDLAEDYQTRDSVISVMNSISVVMSEYLTLLGEIQDLGYLPNYQLIRSLYNTVGKALGQLFIFAQNALQQRNYILTQDMTLVTLHHRLYGNIDTLTEFAAYNNLTTEELLVIKKDREVIYFV